MIEKCRKIGSNIIDLIAVLLIGFVFIANLLRTCRVSYDDAEVVSYSTSTCYVFFCSYITAKCILLFAYNNKNRY